MNKRLLVITVGLVAALLVGMQVKHHKPAVETFSEATVKYGSAGSDVYELQGRLKHLGFYKGNIDGDFGYNTLKSVKWFQSEFGMNVDGIVGSKTKLKLWEATRSWRPSAPAGGGGGAGPSGGGGGGADSGATIKPPSLQGLSDNDLKIMANAVYGESRGEPYIGQVAVAAVILNRLKSPSFPHTISGVIFQPGAFTAVADGQIWLTPNENAKKAVRDAVNGNDPTGGCIYYFNPVTATSKWIWSRPQVKTIGKHIFCK
ncbi:spore cortex-lytic enzyme [Paenibacillus sp. MBLB4367]|uniref:spore cortex-lytic enzyme n=1 Tax=Paenibacillus sp. MBLB4367 TaxID=3384767 RepID=UPI0039083808